MMRFLRNIDLARGLAVLLVATTGLMSFAPYLARGEANVGPTSADDAEAQPGESAELGAMDPNNGSLLHDLLSRALADEIVRQAVMTSTAAPSLLSKIKLKTTSIAQTGSGNASRSPLPATILVAAVPILSDLIALLSAARSQGP